MTKAKQLKQDKRNYRKHSERNRELIRKSIDEAGFGRSVVVDADDVLVCGNGVQSVIDPDTPTRIIETDGSELIVVKRTDLHEGDERRNRLAMADNATADHVEWDMEMLSQDFDMEEIGRFDIEFDFGEDVNPDDFGDEFSLPNEGKAEFGTMTFTVTDSQRDFINDCISLATNCEGMTEVTDNKNENGAALFLICKEWFERFDYTEKPFDVVEKEYKELRQYLCNALKASGKKNSDVDALLGTSGMSGHYFGESQWMFPTRDAYEKLKTIMTLDRDYMECKLKEIAYNRAKKITEIKK